MMVFRAPNGRTYKLKVAIPGRAPRTFSTGTTDEAVARDVEAMVRRKKARREWAHLAPLFDGLVTLGELYDADVTGTVDALIARAHDTDLDPLVAEWATHSNAKYVRQVRAFIPEGERFPASSFRRKTISAFLAGLTCSDPTKNRYRAALSVFGKWLVEREVLDANPVRDVAMYKEHDPRMIWMTWDDAWKVAKAAPQPLRALFALMAGSGIELGAALRLRQTDFDAAAQTIHARGSKTAWRNRVIRCELFAVAELSVVTAAQIGPVAVFPPMKHRDILRAFREAQQAVGLSGHRLHDLRHTYAVNALRKGYRPHVVAHQLGHKDATMVLKVYGRFIPDASDYETGSADKVATTTSRKMRGRRA